MNEKDDPYPHKSWLERLSDALLREPQDRKQLFDLLRDAKKRELLDQDALAMIEGVLKVSEMKVRDVMIPRAQMVVVAHDVTVQQALPIITDSAHSRFPVIGENRDEVIGILLAKDLLQDAIEEQKGKTLIKNLVRPATYIPESKRLDVLLKEFRLNRNHMAIVVDEYGSVAGLVTIEDVLEQIVGDIEDEHDVTDQEPDIEKITENEYSIKALTSIEEFNQYFKTNISDEDCDTFGGYIMRHFGHMPKQGESIIINSFQITVVLASKRRIQLIHLKKSSHEE